MFTLDNLFLGNWERENDQQLPGQKQHQKCLPHYSHVRTPYSVFRIGSDHGNRGTINCMEHGVSKIIIIQDFNKNAGKARNHQYFEGSLQLFMMK